MHNPCKEVGQCPCCGRLRPEPRTTAERLLDLADKILADKGGLVLATGGLGAEHLAMADLALKLRRKHPAFVFRAVAEGWDHYRLVREMY